MANLVKVTVIVHENSRQAYSCQITYFEGQDYTVGITTPDGTDWKKDFKAGELEKKQ